MGRKWRQTGNHPSLLECCLVPGPVHLLWVMLHFMVVIEDQSAEDRSPADADPSGGLTVLVETP